MKIKRNIKYWGFATLFAISISACSTQRRIKKANERYEIGEYNKAATIYRRLIPKTKTRQQRAEMTYKMGECYHRVNNITRASAAYRSAIRYNYDDFNVYLNYAETLLEQNKIKEARENYVLYLAENPDNTQAINGLTACDSLAAWDLKTRYSVSLAKPFQSRRSSNFSPAFAGKAEDLVYFSTNREGVTGGNNTSPITGLRNNDIYVISQNHSGKWNDGEAVSNINTEFDEGTPSFTADGKTMYFTRARHEKGRSLGAAIYVSKRSAAEWGTPEAVVLLTDSLADTLTIAHPAISSSGQQLIFASDLPNGHGGIDLWMVKKNGNTWSKPLNLGPDINTSGDEVFPYLRKDTLLYFSSDGQPGFGGLDIFCASKDNDTQWRVKNVGLPINSSNDDFGITFSKAEERGYFSSNREDRKGLDHIYAFVLPKLEFKFQGTVIDEESKEPLAGAVIKLIGNDGTNRKISTKKDGSFSYPLGKEVEYVFLTSARGYLNQSGEMTTLNAEESIIHNRNFELTSIRRPIRLNNIFFDFASAQLTEASFEELNALIKILADNPNITIEISAHSDAVGEENVNQKLSQQRAEAVANYLIENAVGKDRLTPIGYGEKKPVVADENMGKQYHFLSEGDTLSSDFIQKLSRADQETAHSINRRTEFKVLSTTYQSKGKKQVLE